MQVVILQAAKQVVFQSAKPFEAEKPLVKVKIPEHRCATLRWRAQGNEAHLFRHSSSPFRNFEATYTRTAACLFPNTPKVMM
jgi:hypothetical protein